MAMTHRDSERIHHPVFERFRLIRDLFDRLQEYDDEAGGRLQDAEHGTRPSTQDDAEAFTDFVIETIDARALLRLSQLVPIYSTLESLCRGYFGEDDVDKRVVNAARNARKRNGYKMNFLLAFLREMSRKGMDSAVWPKRRSLIRVFALLRNHLVHTGWVVDSKLQDKLRGHVGNLYEFPGANAEEKLELIGSVGATVSVPTVFVRTVLDSVERLAVEILVPQDHEVKFSRMLEESEGAV